MSEHTPFIDLANLPAPREGFLVTQFITVRSVARSRAFAPILAGNGGGAILNVLSVLSWLHVPAFGAYSAAKAAAWAMTDVARQELAPSGINVAALHVAYMDTDMVAHIDAPKANPADVAALALEGIETGLTEILADEITRSVKQGLSAPPARPPIVVA